MNAKILMNLYPDLSPEDAVYYEKRYKQELANQIKRAEKSQEALWFFCLKPDCDSRAFSITLKQFNEAEKIIHCEYCDTECVPTYKRTWSPNER